TNVGVNSTVLVVDDEPAVRHVAQRMLHRLGFTVYDAGSSDEALAIMREHGERIMLALIDLTMPGMTGDELADTLLKQFSTLRIILTSGFSQQEVPAHLRATGKVSFLAKPFTMNTLSQAINTALSSHAL
ncbi:MAG: response regulator, partial [Chloroflexus sp.]|nr:response regulator [Chloroflexus sp.]